MKLRPLPLLSIILLFIPFVSVAAISGRVVDENGSPVSFAQLVAFDNDSTTIENTNSTTDGNFRFSKHGIRFINASAFGFEQKTVSVTEYRDPANIIISLSPSVNKLNEVTVTGNKKPLTRLDGDALAVNVAGTYLAKSGTANMMLAKIPTVSGRDGVFEVFGRGRAVIYINGRRMMNASDLDRIQASEIKDVKVISNPGPKYSSSTRAVIEIRTTKPQGEGLGVNASVGAKMAYYFSPSAQLNLTYRSGGLDIGLTGMTWKDRLRLSSDNVQELHTPKEVTLDLDQSVKNVQTNNLTTLRLNYQISPRHSLGGYYNLSWKKEAIDFNNMTKIFQESVITDIVRNHGRETNSTRPAHSANAYYNGQIGNVAIDYNIDYLNSSRNSRARHEETAEQSADRIVESLYETSSSMWAQKLVATFRAGKSRTEAGAEYTDSRIHMKYDNYYDPGLSDNNKIKENNIAAFWKYTVAIANRFEISAGLRYEHVNYRYFLNGVRVDDRNRTYDDLFPSASLSGKFGKLGTSLSFSSSMSRPSYGSLDGNIRYVNRFLYMKGNPELKPSRTNTLQFMANFSPAFLRASFSVNHDPIIDETSIIDPDNDICLLSYVNSRDIKMFDVTAGASFGGSGWNLSASAGLEKQWFKILRNDVPTSLGKPRISFKCSGSVKIPADIWIMGDFSVSSAGHSGNVYIRPRPVLNLTLYRTFFKRQLTVWVTGSDLFNASSRAIFYSNHVTTNTINKFNKRGCTITLRYNLNVPKSRYKGKGAGNREKSRL